MINQKSLCDICSPKQWKTISSDMLLESGYPVYGANGIIGYYSECNHKDRTLLITCRGATCGELNICEPYSYVNGNAMALDNLSADVDIRYLYYYLQHRGFSDVITGSAQPQIVRQSLEKVNICYPEVERQKQIAMILDRISGLILLRKNQFIKLDELVKARFVEMFGDPVSNPRKWEQKRFDTICENLDSRRIPITASDRKQGIYPYYGASGIVDYVDDYIFDEDILLISEDGANLIARVTPIAFSVSGKVWVNNHAHVVRFKDRCTQTYIEHYFALIDISDCITGTAQPKLNQAKLNAIMVPIPDLKLQDRFYTFTKKVAQQGLTIQQSLDKLMILKKSLMQEYF